VLEWLPGSLQQKQPFVHNVTAGDLGVKDLAALVGNCVRALRWGVADRAALVGGAMASGEETAEQAAEQLVHLARTFASAYVAEAFAEFADDPVRNGASDHWVAFRSGMSQAPAPADDSPPPQSPSAHTAA
jgi:hypothetical protein